MSTKTRVIEVCTNAEWLDLAGTWQEEAAGEWFGRVVTRLEAEMGVETIAAQGQRAFCHGWNGANTFAHKGSGLGTFDDFTPEEWAKAEDIAIEEQEAVRNHYAETEQQEAIDWLAAAAKEYADDPGEREAKQLCEAWSHCLYQEVEESDPRLAPYRAAVERAEEAVAEKA